MNYNGPNWYSTNSVRKFQNSNNYAPYRQPHIQQFSDEGRVPLGSADDPEAVQLREKIRESVSEETRKLWQEYRKQWSDKCLLRKPQVGLNEEVEAKYRNYPEKATRDIQSAPNGEQNMPRETLFPQWEDRSKYVLNRKVNRANPIPSTSSEHALSSAHETATPSTDDQEDHIFIDDREPSANSTIRLILSGDEQSAEKGASSSSNFAHTRRVTPETKQKPLRKNPNPPVVEKTTSTSEKTLTATAPSNVPECRLGKHCLDPLTCPKLHDGVLTKIPGKTFTRRAWPVKLPSVPICPGYVNLTCWNFDCERRHVAYPSDHL